MNLHFAFGEKGCIIKPYLKGGKAMDYRVAVCDDQQEIGRASCRERV